jgi:hypothetical protein
VTIQKYMDDRYRSILKDLNILDLDKSRETIVLLE